MLTLNRQEVQNAFKTLGKCTARHSSIPVLQSVLIEASEDGLLLTTTDLEIGATICVPGIAGRQERCRTLINAGQFASLVSTLRDDEINVGVEGDTLTVGHARIKTNMSADDYPDVPKAPDYPAGVYEPGSDFLRAVRFCAAAVSSELTRYPLTGLYLDFPRGAIVGSDGKRLHFARLGEPGNIPPQIVPRRIFDAVTPERIVVPHPEKDEEGQDRPPQHIFFSFPNGTAFARVVEGRFPEYDHVVPAKCSTCFTLERAELLEGLRQVLPLVSKRQPSCKIEVNGTLDLSVQNEDDGTEAAVRVHGTLAGNEVAVKLNPHFLREILDGIPGNTLGLYFQGAEAAMLVEDPASEWFGLIMPLRS